MYYNTYFAGQLIAMAPPLSDEGVDYADKTTATVKQQAEDVVTFLTWAAQPELEERKRMGIKVILFLLLLTGLLYVVKRRIWADVH
jgi:cytochrome c1